MLDGLNEEEWIVHRVKFKEIIHLYDDRKIISKWKSIVPYFDGLNKKNKKAESLAHLNKFFSSLPDELHTYDL